MHTFDWILNSFKLVNWSLLETKQHNSNSNDTWTSRFNKFLILIWTSWKRRPHQRKLSEGLPIFKSILSWWWDVYETNIKTNLFNLEQLSWCHVPHCAVEQMSVFIELIGKFQLMVVHQIIVDDYKEWLVGREGLQTASCTCRVGVIYL